MTLSPTNFVTVPLPGNSSYTSYMLVFPTLRDATSTNSMHISEIQLDTTCGADFDTISSSSTPLSFHTLASDFDTELALFDAAGNLLESNDDISPSKRRSAAPMRSTSCVVSTGSN